MAPVDVPWPKSSNPGKRPNEGSGRLINCYAYQDGEGYRWGPLPGINDFVTGLPAGEIRGELSMDSYALAVVGSSVVQYDASGTFTVLDGTVAGDGPVTMSRNNNTTPDIVITSSNGVYVVVGDTINTYPDADLPQSANSICVIDGFFIFTLPDGRTFASGLNSTSVDALSFARAEAKPDGLYRGFVYGELVFLCGPETIEVWQDVGNTPFPMSRSTVIAIGLIGQWAVAGFEDGYTGLPMWVAQDNSLRRLDGYTPTRVSADDLEALIKKVADKSTLRASVYADGGNAFWSLSSPDWTWDFNVTTGFWSERESYGKTRWKGQYTLYAFSKWLVADVDGGTIYAMDAESRVEGDDPLVWGMDSGPVKQFPARIALSSMVMDFVLGQTLMKDRDPQVMISWSHNGGATWANPLTRSLKNLGDFIGRVMANRLGLTSPMGFRARFRISDPVDTSFAGARVDAAQRG